MSETLPYALGVTHQTLVERFKEIAVNSFAKVVESYRKDQRSDGELVMALTAERERVKANMGDVVGKTLEAADFVYGKHNEAANHVLQIAEETGNPIMTDITEKTVASANARVDGMQQFISASFPEAVRVVSEGLDKNFARYIREAKKVCAENAKNVATPN